VNDGSDDPESLEKLTRVRVMEDVRVVDRPNGDLAAARNTGAREARGEWLLFLDPDDVMEQTTLELLVWAALLHPTWGFFYTGVTHFGDIEGTCVEEWDPERLMRENFLTSMALMRRDLYLAVGGQDESEREIYEDWDFWLRLLSLGIGGHLVPEPLFRYRRHGLGRSAWVAEHTPGDDALGRLRARHPALFAGGKVSLPPPLGAAEGPNARLADEFGRRLVLDARPIRTESYRRPNVPDPFSPRHRTDGRIRILYCVPFLTMGGAERVDLQILEGLPRNRFHVTVVVEQDGGEEWADEYRACSDELFRLRSLRSDAPGEAAFLDYLVFSRDVSIIFNRNTEVGYRLGARWRERTDQVAFVDLLHLHNSGEDWIRAAHPWDMSLDRRFVITDDLRDYCLRNASPAADRYTVVHCGVRVDRFDPDAVDPGRLRDLVGTGPNEPLVAFVGRLDEQKRPLLWLEMAARVAAEEPRVRFAMIGGGPLESCVQEACEQLGVADRVTLVGPRADLPELLRDVDLLVGTSAYEGLPLVVFEAMAMGVGVVATDVGGTRECVVPELGTLVPADSTPDRIAMEVLRMIRTPGIGVRKRRREWIRSRFTVERMQRAYCNELTKLARPLNSERRHQDFCRLLLEGPILP
ncbi:MAG TPA: glycosyltransferase, partial [bacterium]|nr:glycosyltransferase [bacterium]